MHNEHFYFRRHTHTNGKRLFKSMPPLSHRPVLKQIMHIYGKYFWAFTGFIRRHSKPNNRTIITWRWRRVGFKYVLYDLTQKYSPRILYFLCRNRAAVGRPFFLFLLEYVPCRSVYNVPRHIYVCVCTLSDGVFRDFSCETLTPLQEILGMLKWEPWPQ